jgi:hypothetical protein
MTRLNLFRSMSEEIITRKSKDVTHEVIKNSFKVTQLEEIEEMRRRNEERKRREALRGSDDEDDDDEDFQPHEEDNNKQSLQK